MTLQAHQSTDVPYSLTRLGVVMSVDPTDPLERDGVLNPGTARGPDGTLYLYPRVVAEGNMSRILRARVVLVAGVPSSVRREGVALAPDEGWERGRDHAGVEDPRITWVPALGRYVMTYIAFGPVGPRPALATSRDGLAWTRLGPIRFGYEPQLGTDLDLFPNKDVVVFPEPVPGPGGRPSFAVLHRPMWDLSYVRGHEEPPLPRTATDPRPSIWISYVDVDAAVRDPRALAVPYGHREVAVPCFWWEEAKIGAGPAPVRVPEGWLLIHHGVTGVIDGDGFAPQKAVHYRAGAMLLDPGDPSRVLARTAEPLLSPSTQEETRGTVSNVVFPTAVEEVDGVRYLFYGMADTAIGVARLDRVVPPAGR